MDVYGLAKERGCFIDEVEVALGEGGTRPGWLIFHLGGLTFVPAAVNWTTRRRGGVA